MDGCNVHLDLTKDCELNKVESGEFIFIDAYCEDRRVDSLVIEYIPTSRLIGEKERHLHLYQNFDIDYTTSKAGSGIAKNVLPLCSTIIVIILFNVMIL